MHPPDKVSVEELWRYLHRGKPFEYVFEHATEILKVLKPYQQEYVMNFIKSRPFDWQRSILEKHPSIDTFSLVVLWPPAEQKVVYPDEAPAVIVAKWPFEDQLKYYAKYPPNYESAVKAKYSETKGRIRRMEQVLYTRKDELWWVCGCVAKDDLHASAALSIYCHFHGKEHDIHVPWMKKILTE